jgi:hypothetical protein
LRTTQKARQAPALQQGRKEPLTLVCGAKMMASFFHRAGNVKAEPQLTGDGIRCSVPFCVRRCSMALPVNSSGPTRGRHRTVIRTAAPVWIRRSMFYIAETMKSREVCTRIAGTIVQEIRCEENISSKEVSATRASWPRPLAYVAQRDESSAPRREADRGGEASDRRGSLELSHEGRH